MTVTGRPWTKPATAPIPHGVEMRRSRQSPFARWRLLQPVPVATLWIVGLALVKLTLHVVTSGGYGYFRDELYFMDAGRHLDFGYVDFPPMVALLAAAIRVTTGYSLLALRFLPAVTGAAVVLLCGLMARELGGGSFAQALAALTALLSPILLAVDSFFSMNPFEQLCWALLAYLVMRMLISSLTSINLRATSAMRFE